MLRLIESGAYLLGGSAMDDQNPVGRPLPLSALAERDKARWTQILDAADHLSCEDTPVNLGKADASAAFLSIDDLRERCDAEHLKPLRSIIRSIRADATHVYVLSDGDAASLSELVDRAVEGLSADLEPVWSADGSLTMRRWRGAGGIHALTRALKDRCL
jgi:hypothetical protein